MRFTFSLLLVAVVFVLSSCKKSKGTMADMRETEMMAVDSGTAMPAPAVKPASNDVSKKDGQLEASLSEIASGFKVDAVLAVYAGQHAANPKVKKFANSLGKSSADAGRRLKELSEEYNFSLPVAIIPSHESELVTLKGKRKDAFDESYLPLIQKILAERRTLLESVLSSDPAPLADFSTNYLQQFKALELELRRLNGRRK